MFTFVYLDINKLLVSIFTLALLSNTVPAIGYAKNGGENNHSFSSSERQIPPGQAKKLKIAQDDDEDNTNSCPTKAFGHLIASGWIKNKNGGEIPKISDDCQLPHGIWKKIHGDDNDHPHQPPTPTSTDVTAPAITNIATGSSTSTTIITWNTNELADSQIAYGTSTSYGLLSSLDNTLVTSHSIELTGLLASTTYHFSIHSRDASNNLATSTDYTFTTLSLPDTTAPIISLLLTTSTTASSTVVIWDTDELATTKVYYSIFGPIDINASSTLSFGTTTLVMQHSTTLLGLNASTTYYLLVESSDVSNNAGTATTIVTTLP